MALHIKTGLTAPEGFINDVFEIDKITYSPELCGKIENLSKRYERCRESFLLLYDEDKLAGYINFFPVGEKLHSEMINREDLRMRDDDISPEEIEDWNCQNGNNLFILSVALRPEYRKSKIYNGEAIILLSNSFLEFLREKNTAGYKISSISGYAISLGGVKFLKRMNASLLKDTVEKYHFFFANTENVSDFLENGYTFNTYKKLIRTIFISLFP